uniref:DUF4214 domain-containing protein n=1 Tax=Teichococcus vastitatis TaxID=2307076 RepID=UPI0013008BF6
MASFNDPEFPDQWPLQSARLTSLYDEYSGQGIRIGQVDTRRWPDDPELQGQVDLAASVTAPGTSVTDLHGQQVAELLVGKANNGNAGIGAAYGAQLVAYTFNTIESRTLAQETQLLALQSTVDISHNSWGRSGSYFRDDFLRADYAPAAAAIADAAAQGRGGLGTVIVRSAGNGALQGDDVNTHNYVNNRHTITVGAAFENGDVAPMSNPGAALLVVGPGTATSWAAPIVSGTAALMLEANPSLGYRDVQTILALSARMTDGDGAGWFFNAAGNWNGGAMHVSRRAGFGLVDAHAAVRLAESWEAQSTAANLSQATARNDAAIGLADNGRIEQSVQIADAIRVERAELTLDLRHDRVGDLRIALVSPSGTESVLLDRLGLGSYDPASNALTFTMGSTQFLNEAAQGGWRLRIDDLAAGATGTLRSWSLTVSGSMDSPDTQHVYTDEFASLAGPARRVLQDVAGTDTINGAALTADARIDLSGAGVSSIAGQQLSLAAGTVIENAIGGDGNDWLTGNDLANRLQGGRGNDRLEGGGGDDLLEPGRGVDSADGGAGRDVLKLDGPFRAFASQRDGDALTLRSGGDAVVARNIEQADFVDGRLVLDQDDPIAQVYRLYDAAFNRAPDQGGLNAYAADVSRGRALADVAGGFVTSEEFALRYGPDLPNQGFVEQLYRNVLDREGDAAGIQNWTGALNGGASRAGVLVGFSESPEHQAILTPNIAAGLWDRSENAALVARLYDSVFARLPDLDGLSNWTGQLDRGGMAAGTVAENFLGSAEARLIYGPELSSTELVNALYVNA